jgi:hypothetical protein
MDALSADPFSVLHSITNACIAIVSAFSAGAANTRSLLADFNGFSWMFNIVDRQAVSKMHAVSSFATEKSEYHAGPF